MPAAKKNSKDSLYIRQQAKEKSGGNMVRKNMKRIIAALMIVSLFIMSCVTAFAAGNDKITLPVTVKYGQTEARTMLDMINGFRTGNLFSSPCT